MKLNWESGIGIVYVLFAGGMVLFAIKATQQKNDLVSAHYYDEAVNYQQKIDAGNNAAQTNSKLSLKYVLVENAVALLSDDKLKNVKGYLSFYKPDRAEDDFQVGFSLDETGKQTVQLKKMAHGYWKVTATWNIDDKQYNTETRIFVQ